jgi:peptidoglycan L-alanyl-D-glutamate endopeptidase CwlK
VNKIDTLESGFREQVEELMQKVEEVTGLHWVITSGRRTMQEQEVLYAQGRTAPGKVVTKAPPGSSAHNFGLAADLAPLKADGTIWWEAPKMKWRVMADMALQMGLVPGFYFKTIFDAPHVESKDWRTAQALWKTGKLRVQ